MATTNLVDEIPQSVEEAGALLGATVIGYGSSSFVTTNPPKGIHSSFETVSPVPSSELLHRLHALRSLLRSAPKETPLVAAPSLLAGVLMKLLGMSSGLAGNMSSTGSDSVKPNDVPPMLSTPVRYVVLSVNMSWKLLFTSLLHFVSYFLPQRFEGFGCNVSCFVIVSVKDSRGTLESTCMALFEI
jgi:hypothetical protein